MPDLILGTPAADMISRGLVGLLPWGNIDMESKVLLL
jgi:hypothetical protein